MGASSIIFLMLFSACAAAVPAPTTPTGKCPNETAFEALANKCDGSMKKLETSMKASIYQLKTELAQMTKQMLTTESDDFDLLFHRGSTEDYVIIHDLPDHLYALTISLWMRTTDRSNTAGALLSYAISSNTNAMVVEYTRGVTLQILGSSRKTSMILNDGEWHHVVFTWNGYSGSSSAYLDGQHVHEYTGLYGVDSVKRVSKYGALVLGQEQDDVGGGFERESSYIGLLSKVNIWDSVLSKSQLVLLKQNCGRGFHGNIFKWDHSLFAGIRGFVQVMRPSSCPRTSLLDALLAILLMP